MANSFNVFTIGVKRASMVFRKNAYKNSKTYYSNEFEGHFYTFTNEDGSRISHSGGKNGLEWKKTPYSFKRTSYYYLRLQLSNVRKI